MPPVVYFGTWQIGTPGTDKVAYHNLNVAANSFSEFAISPALCDDKRNLRIRFRQSRQQRLAFSLKTVWKCSIPKGGFRSEFSSRGLGIILCWLPCWRQSGWRRRASCPFRRRFFLRHDPGCGAVQRTPATSSSRAGRPGESRDGRGSANPVIWWSSNFKSILWVVNLVEVSRLSIRSAPAASITWGQLGLAGLMNIVVLGRTGRRFGMVVFTRPNWQTAPQ